MKNMSYHCGIFNKMRGINVHCGIQKKTVKKICYIKWGLRNVEDRNVSLRNHLEIWWDCPCLCLLKYGEIHSCHSSVM